MYIKLNLINERSSLEAYSVTIYMQVLVKYIKNNCVTQC